MSDTTSDVDLRTLVTILWVRRWTIVLSVALVTGAFGIAAILMTPMYRAATVLVPADLERSSMGALNSALTQFGGLAALAGVSGGSAGAVTEESMAVMRSREFTEAFIRDEELILELFYSRSKSAETDPPTLGEAFKFFDREVRTVSRDTRTGLVTVGIEWRDPEMAARWANNLVTRLNAEMRARAIANSSASVGYLERELATTAIVDTRAAISRLMEAQINQRMLANVTQEYAFRVVDRALPPDADDVVRPRKLLMILMGAVAGFLIGVVVAVLLRRPV